MDLQSDACRHVLPHVRVKEALANQVLYRGTLAERAREANVGALEQRGLPRLLQREQPAHLCVQPSISERVRRELVAQETAHNFLGEHDGTQSQIRSLFVSASDAVRAPAPRERERKAWTFAIFH